MSGFDSNSASAVPGGLFDDATAGEAPPLPSGRVMAERIESLKSPAGGWTRASLAQLGVPWPPPKGWRRALIEGRPVGSLPPSRRRRSAPPPHEYRLPEFKRRFIRYAGRQRDCSDTELDVLSTRMARELPSAPFLLIRWRPPYLTAAWKEGDMKMSLGVHRPDL